MIRVPTMALLLAALVACESAPEPAPPAAPAPTAAPAPKVSAQVTKAVEIAQAIAKAPENAAGILAEHGMDAEALDALMYEIAASPELSAQYAAARGG